ncbi:formyl-coenzyme A transferase [Saccharicrinis fermentans DSM 9555 = JCM 21142]|uniref:Formyl-coenzyme A transferase n=1 Tax=Saccharicrinis fermentans DSM 9555 = JCM 21142 TaxID=869213 RepID=W7YAB0_9BACT|nr:formyl-coenzyme A transferase [Saccharicrinis fermentans DSM 9555 = JCM 21142]
MIDLSHLYFNPNDALELLNGFSNAFFGFNLRTLKYMNLPLKGITVLEFAQFMAGPSAGLKMADLGARVIKIERPGTGEAGSK